MFRFLPPGQSSDSTSSGFTLQHPPWHNVESLCVALLAWYLGTIHGTLTPTTAFPQERHKMLARAGHPS